MRELASIRIRQEFFYMLLNVTIKMNLYRFWSVYINLIHARFQHLLRTRFQLEALEF